MRCIVNAEFIFIVFFIVTSIRCLVNVGLWEHFDFPMMSGKCRVFEIFYFLYLSIICGKILYLYHILI
ncbi:hypothetical protein X975_08263, partial [Stegodyphus mimosarum]